MKVKALVILAAVLLVAAVAVNPNPTQDETRVDQFVSTTIAGHPVDDQLAIFASYLREQLGDELYTALVYPQNIDEVRVFARTLVRSEAMVEGNNVVVDYNSLCIYQHSDTVWAVDYCLGSSR